jgi:hypothetical protein
LKVSIIDSHRVNEQYCIYWNPSDYPKQFVVRRWGIHPETGYMFADDDCKVFTRLTGARKSIPNGFVSIGRDKKDDATIVEVWI